MSSRSEATAVHHQMFFCVQTLLINAKITLKQESQQHFSERIIEAFSNLNGILVNPISAVGQSRGSILLQNEASL